MKIIKASIVLILILFPVIVFAAERTVTIEWAMSDTENIQGYKIYLAYDLTMENAEVVCDTPDPNSTNITCKNIDIEKYPVYFSVAAVTNDGGELLSSPAKMSAETLNPPQRLRISQ